MIRGWALRIVIVLALLAAALLACSGLGGISLDV